MLHSWDGRIECCLKGCENEAGSHEFDSTIGQCEIKCTRKDTTSDFKQNSIMSENVITLTRIFIRKEVGYPRKKKNNMAVYHS